MSTRFFRGYKYLAPKITVEIYFIADVARSHGLWTPNEGINHRYLKNWADVADKICLGRT